MKALIIGQGNVGKALSGVLSINDWQHSFFTGKTINADFIRQASLVDVIFLAISTKGIGAEALRYLLCSVELGKIIITAEKAALAYHWETLSPHLNKNIGLTTTVGGSSNMLSLFEERNPEEIESVVGIVNGTINFLSWFIQTGQGKINDALRTAKEKGLLDSRSTSLCQIIDEEISDALKKSVIIYKSAGLTPNIHPQDFSYWLLSSDEYLRLLSRNQQTRFVVSIEKTDKRVMPQSGFDLYVRPWHIQGRFVDHADELMHGLTPEAENNCLVVNHSLNIGWESKSGIGAGSKITAETMFNEALSFVNSKTVTQ